MIGQAPPESERTAAPAADPGLERPRHGEQLHRELLAAANGAAHFVVDAQAPAWALLNEAGLQVLNLCDGTRSAEQIADEIAKATGDDPGTVRVRVDAFLAQLAATKLIGVGPEVSSGQLPERNRFRGIALEITRACNLSCRHCYLGAGKQAANDLTRPELERVIRQVAEAGGISLSIGGGEPLLHPDWRGLVERALSLGLLVVVGTNGTLIDTSLARALASLPIKIQLSLDGATADAHDAIRGGGSFARTRRAIDLLRDAGKGDDLVVAFTAMRSNLAQVPAFLDLMETLGIRVVQFPPLAATGRARGAYQEIALDDEGRLTLWRAVRTRAAQVRGRMDLLADCFSLDIDRPGVPYRCNIGSQLRVDPGGAIYPCQCFHGGSEYRLGSVREQSIADTVAGARLRSVIDACLTRPEQIGSCSRCRWMNLCGAGCMGGAYETNGAILTPEGCGVRERWLRELFAERFGQMPATRQDA